ncbi:MAG: hypothetical protein IJ638_03665 [Alphaproteobacteria bacterium]|nr:hypothetical protein [Alphaproteobacteria bacterium]
MKKINNKNVFVKIHSQVKETSVIPFITNNGLKKENDCQECASFCGNSIDCYSCLLANKKSRNELDNVISKNTPADVYKYIDFLQKNASKHGDMVSKRLSDIVESAMYLNLL